MSARLFSYIPVLVWEFRIQLRYYIWLTALVVSAVWLVLLSALSETASRLWVPVLIFADISNIGLLFIAGILFLERGQGTVYATAVTPVSAGMWVGLKLFSLTLLCSVCAIILVLFNVEGVNWARMLPAIVLCSALFVSCGFLIACPIERIMNYFLVMVFALAILNLPVLDHVGIFEHGLFWLLPSQPAMWLLGNSFQGNATTTFYAVVLVQMLWIALIHWYGVRSFRKSISLY